MTAEPNKASGDDWLYTVPEAPAALRISRSHFFKLRRQGVITTIKLGRRTAVPRRGSFAAKVSPTLTEQDRAATRPAHTVE